jgi:hypothetical protein
MEKLWEQYVQKRLDKFGCPMPFIFTEMMMGLGSYLEEITEKNPGIIFSDDDLDIMFNIASNGEMAQTEGELRELASVMVRAVLAIH